jgi:hypothetical protein
MLFTQTAIPRKITNMSNPDYLITKGYASTPMFMVLDERIIR